MIEIKHRFTGKILHSVDADTLVGAKLCGLDLKGANFRDANLRDADLHGADLYDATFTGATLVGADLSGANLHEAMLRGVTLRAADLRRTRLTRTTLDNAYMRSVLLSGCDLSWATLTGAVLRDANLELTRIQSTDLTGADLSEAVLGHTSLMGLTTLHLATGLETVRFTAPCVVDHYTLSRCVPGLPDAFLEGIGVAGAEIGTLRTLYTHRAASGFDCFVHGNESDTLFAERLIRDLRAHSIPAWRYRSKEIYTRFWEERALQALRQDDRLVLICSRRTDYPRNLIMEIGKLLTRQEVTGEPWIFPVLLDDHLYSERMVEEAREDSQNREWHQTWLPALRRMKTFSFQGGETDDAVYAQCLSQLLKTMKGSAEVSEPTGL